jgi:hypothetical protein
VDGARVNEDVYPKPPRPRPSLPTMVRPADRSIRLLDPELTEFMLDRLDNRLRDHGLRGDLYVVDGRPVMVGVRIRIDRRAVGDVFDAKERIYDHVRVAVVRRRPISFDWLDAYALERAGEDRTQRLLLDRPGLRIAVAAPRFVLVLKLLGEHVDRDDEDLRYLYARCGFSMAEEGLDLLARTYPGHRVLPAVRRRLEAMVAA